MNVVKAVIEYFKKWYPNFEYSTDFVSDSNGMTHTTMFPIELMDELRAFFSAYDLAWNEGYHSALKHSTEEYTKNIQDVTISVYSAGFNEGFSQGKELGFSEGYYKEMSKSIIPSNAFDIEVFAVKPSNDENNGQAFIGYKYFLEGEQQFHFITVPFTAPNLKSKNKIYDEQNTKQICTKASYKNPNSKG